MNGRISLSKNLTEKDIQKLFNNGWKCVNEERSPLLIKKIDEATVCMHFNGSILIQSLPNLEKGQEIYKKITKEIRKIVSSIE